MFTKDGECNNGRRGYEDKKRDQDDRDRNTQPRGPIIK